MSEVVTMRASPAARLRSLLIDAKSSSRCELMPACYDALSAKLIAKAGYQMAFMSGFAVSATQLAMPDVGLISYGEQLDAGRRICETANELLVIGDGDTGFGGAGNVRRAIEGYARAGFAGITIEDQVYPKRCPFSGLVSVESRDDAIARVRCAIRARDDLRARTGLDLVIVARTDCRFAEGYFTDPKNNNGKDLGLQEATARCKAFAALGADVVYAERLTLDELAQLRSAIPLDVTMMLAQVEQESKPVITAEQAASAGCSLSLFGLTVLSASIVAMQRALHQMRDGPHHPSVLSHDPHRWEPASTEAPVPLMNFAELKSIVGFDDHDAWEKRSAEGLSHAEQQLPLAGSSHGGTSNRKRSRD